MMKVLLKLFLILALLAPSSCYHIKPPEKIFQRESFVFIHKMIVVHDGTTIREYEFTGSGFIVAKYRNSTVILTAGHICYNEHYEKQLASLKTFRVFTVHDIEDKPYSAKVIKINKEHDLCSLHVENMGHRPLKISAGVLEEGSELFNMAAPAAIFMEKNFPLLHGYYTGRTPRGVDMYTVPATGGSSGSPILNKRGELVGMLHSVSTRFPFVSFGTNIEHIRPFIVSSLNEIK